LAATAIILNKNYISESPGCVNIIKNFFPKKGKRDICQEIKGLPAFYRDYNSYLRELFGCRVQKITLDAGLSCPNRDGTKGLGGCIYCNGKGSGTGASRMNKSIAQQIREAKPGLRKRYRAEKFIAYFQSFSNTYAPLSVLEGLYQEALQEEDIVGLSIGTRPDCVIPEILDLLAGYQKKYQVWLEYGLQSFHPETLERINRGHTIEDFIRAVDMTRKRGLNICVHVILGLPGEGLEEIHQTAQNLARLDVQGLKIHCLYINKDTPLEEWYREGRFQPISQTAYVQWACDFLALVPPHWVIQRLTGDPDPGELVAPLWALKKQETIGMIRSYFQETCRYQGCSYETLSQRLI
jgi:hypothetical protein